MEATSAVSLTKVMASLPMEGRVTRIICGMMMRVMVWKDVRPRTCETSYCPRSMESSPPRKISAK